MSRSYLALMYFVEGYKGHKIIKKKMRLPITDDPALFLMTLKDYPPIITDGETLGNTDSSQRKTRTRRQKYHFLDNEINGNVKYN